MTEIKEAFESLGMKKIDEKSIEMKEVTVKLNFTFEDGEIKDPLQGAIYEMLVSNNAIIEESTAEANEQADEFEV